MQYGQTIIGKYSSHFLATKQYKMAGAKFVSGTLLPENIYLFHVIEGHSFLSMLLDYFHQINKSFLDLSKTIWTCPSIGLKPFWTKLFPIKKNGEKKIKPN